MFTFTIEVVADSTKEKIDIIGKGYMVNWQLTKNWTRKRQDVVNILLISE